MEGCTRGVTSRRHGAKPRGSLGVASGSGVTHLAKAPNRGPRLHLARQGHLLVAHLAAEHTRHRHRQGLVTRHERARLEAQPRVAVGMVRPEQRRHVLELHVVLRVAALKVRTEERAHRLVVGARVAGGLCVRGCGEGWVQAHGCGGCGTHTPAALSAAAVVSAAAATVVAGAAKA